MRNTVHYNAVPGTRFDHIAIGVRALTDAAPVLAGVLGGVPDQGRPSGGFRWGTWRYANGGSLEAIEPLGADGFLHRFLAQRGPGIHHVTFKVVSIEAACARARARGYEIVGRDDSDPCWKEAFLHPRQALGIVVQLAEAHPYPAPPPSEPPPGAAGAPPALAVLGLRLSARSRERAGALWGAVLEGELERERARELVYRWGDSPMRVSVEVDPARAEGPLAIEVAGARTPALPPGSHPALGTVFVYRSA